MILASLWLQVELLLLIKLLWFKQVMFGMPLQNDLITISLYFFFIYIYMKYLKSIGEFPFWVLLLGSDPSSACNTSVVFYLSWLKSHNSAFWRFDETLQSWKIFVKDIYHIWIVIYGAWDVYSDDEATVKADNYNVVQCSPLSTPVKRNNNQTVNGAIFSTLLFFYYYYFKFPF